MTTACADFAGEATGRPGGSPATRSAQHSRRAQQGADLQRVRLARTGPSVLAFGAHFKGSICITRGKDAYLPPRMGALDTAASCAAFDATVGRMLEQLEIEPEIVACDLHPDYFSTRAALAFAARRGLPAVSVGHHHAHVAAVCAEHEEPGPVLGLALDGVGLGPDGGAWGGELLTLHSAGCGRSGHLRPLALPGGDRAAREPWRMAASVLHELGRSGEICARFPHRGAATIAAILKRGVNCPRTSSMGRVFDAAAGLLGLCARMEYEAEAAILLERTAARHVEAHGWPQAMPDGWVIGSDGTLDLLPLLASLIDATDADAAAAGFHATLAAALGMWVARAAEASGLRTLAWGGGCFLNALLCDRLLQILEGRGMRVLAPRYLAPDDSAIALGQAWVALQSMEP